MHSATTVHIIMEEGQAIVFDGEDYFSLKLVEDLKLITPHEAEGAIEKASIEIRSGKTGLGRDQVFSLLEMICRTATLKKEFLSSARNIVEDEKQTTLGKKNEILSLESFIKKFAGMNILGAVKNSEEYAVLKKLPTQKIERALSIAMEAGCYHTANFFAGLLK